MVGLSDADLREAAFHRGLKLVKSRKRKPGIGDYGLFGLTEADGKPLFGIRDDELTASAEEIADYLRKGEASTWAASAERTPDRRKVSRSTKVARDEPQEEVLSAIRPRKRRTSPERAVRVEVSLAEHAEPDRSERSPIEGKGRQPGGTSTTRRHREFEPETRVRCEVELSVRAAKPSDAYAILTLLIPLGRSQTVAAVKRAISGAIARKEPILLAERGEVVGCLAWHVVPTLQHDDIARITLIFVDADARRRGVGRKLYEAALSLFQKRKVVCVEGMSDIEVRNANGFFRALGLRQASYRFASEL